MAHEKLARRSLPATVQVQPPRVVIKQPPIKIPEIKIPTINVPPLDLGPIVRVLNSLAAVVSELGGTVTMLRGTVASQQETIQALAQRVSNIKVTMPPRARTYEVEIDDGDGNTRTLRVRAGK